MNCSGIVVKHLVIMGWILAATKLAAAAGFGPLGEPGEARVWAWEAAAGSTRRKNGKRRSGSGCGGSRTRLPPCSWSTDLLEPVIPLVFRVGTDHEELWLSADRPKGGSDVRLPVSHRDAGAQKSAEEMGGFPGKEPLLLRREDHDGAAERSPAAHSGPHPGHHGLVLHLWVSASASWSIQIWSFGTAGPAGATG